MNDKDLEKAQVYIDFVKNNLEPLAEHLKVSVEWLWDILVKQAQVEAIVYLIVVLLLTVKSIVLITIAFKAWKNATFRGLSYLSKTSTNKEGYVVYWCGIGGVVTAIIASITLAITLPIIVTGFVNPEYRAIEKIVEYAKPHAQEQLK